MADKLLKEAEKKWKIICDCDEIQNVLSEMLYEDGEMLDGYNNQQGLHDLIHNFWSIS